MMRGSVHQTKDIGLLDPAIDRLRRLSRQIDDQVTLGVLFHGRGVCPKGNLAGKAERKIDKAQK